MWTFSWINSKGTRKTELHQTKVIFRENCTLEKAKIKPKALHQQQTNEAHIKCDMSDNIVFVYSKLFQSANLAHTLL